MEDKNLPACYNIANKKSLTAQSLYKSLIWVMLSVMLISTILSAIDENILKGWISFNKLNGLILLIPAAASTIFYLVGPEKNWYIGRAVAESVKTLSWRYMMRSQPFQNDNKESRKEFVKRIEQVVTGARKDNFLVESFSTDDNEITPKMDEMRSLPFLERKESYAKFRIDDQIAWYQKKNGFNKSMGRLCICLTVFCQLLAAIYLLFLVDKFKTINLTEIFVFIAASIISLAEMNKYKELHYSYSFTEMELRMIRSKFGAISDDKELDEFVGESEQAISREHITWLARRGSSNYLNY
jgi:membrane protein YdbS with pleckstrin-like domain